MMKSDDDSEFISSNSNLNEYQKLKLSRKPMKQIHFKMQTQPNLDKLSRLQNGYTGIIDQVGIGCDISPLFDS